MNDAVLQHRESLSAGHGRDSPTVGAAPKSPPILDAVEAAVGGGEGNRQQRRGLAARDASTLSSQIAPSSQPGRGASAGLSPMTGTRGKKDEEEKDIIQDNF